MYVKISLISHKIHFHRCLDFSRNCFSFLCDTDLLETITICQIYTNKQKYLIQKRKSFCNQNKGIPKVKQLTVLFLNFIFLKFTSVGKSLEKHSEEFVFANVSVKQGVGLVRINIKLHQRCFSRVLKILKTDIFLLAIC